MTLEAQFEKSKQLAEYAEQLIRERKELDKVLNLLINQVKEDIGQARSFLNGFKQLRQEYVKTLEEFAGQLENLKSFRELIDLNKRLAEALMK